MLRIGWSSRNLTVRSFGSHLYENGLCCNKSPVARAIYDCIIFVAQCTSAIRHIFYIRNDQRQGDITRVHTHSEPDSIDIRSGVAHPVAHCFAVAFSSRCIPDGFQSSGLKSYVLYFQPIANILCKQRSFRKKYIFRIILKFCNTSPSPRYFVTEYRSFRKNISLREKYLVISPNMSLFHDLWRTNVT